MQVLSVTPSVATVDKQTTQPTQTISPAISEQVFDGKRAYEIVAQQVAIGPRITGSSGNKLLGDLIQARLASNRWLTRTDEFTYKNTPVRNLLGIKGTSKEIVILGAHYDTRRRADRDTQHPELPVPGANDGASGVAVLLELARVLDIDKTNKQVWLVFFDAEDNGNLDGWEWIVGSQHFAATMSIKPMAVVVVDMIGDKDQTIDLERTSNQVLAGEIWDVAQRLGYSDIFRRQLNLGIIDDHTPFLERGLPAVDIIDFNYPFYHTTQDTIDKVSESSLERVGRTLQSWLENGM